MVCLSNLIVLSRWQLNVCDTEIIFVVGYEVDPVQAIQNMYFGEKVAQIFFCCCPR